MMATVGKRSSTTDPLTEHDIAARLETAAMRVLRILIETRELGLMDDVKQSRYHTNLLNLLAEEMRQWGHQPDTSAPITSSSLIRDFVRRTANLGLSDLGSSTTTLAAVIEEARTLIAADTAGPTVIDVRQVSRP